MSQPNQILLTEGNDGAYGTAQFELARDGVPCLFVVGTMVVFEKFGASKVDASLVAILDQPLLTTR